MRREPHLLGVDHRRTDPVTQPTLPSVVAAQKFWRGESGALGSILWSMTERAAIIGAALYLAGERKRLLRYTLATTAAIEAVVLWQVKRQIDREG